MLNYHKPEKLGLSHIQNLNKNKVKNLYYELSIEKIEKKLDILNKISIVVSDLTYNLDKCVINYKR